MCMHNHPHIYVVDLHIFVSKHAYSVILAYVYSIHVHICTYMCTYVHTCIHMRTHNNTDVCR